jgi:hypothetical protein
MTICMRLPLYKLILQATSTVHLYMLPLLFPCQAPPTPAAPAATQATSAPAAAGLPPKAPPTPAAVMAATAAAATAAKAAPLLKPNTVSDTDDDTADSTVCSRQSSCLLPLDDSRLPWHKSPAKLAVLLLLVLSAGLVLAALLLQLVLEKSPNQGSLAARTASRLIKVGHALIGTTC